MELKVTECNVSMLYMNAILGRDPFLDKARYPVQWRAPMPIVGWWKSPCSSSMKSTCSVCRRQVCWTPVRASRTHFEKNLATSLFLLVKTHVLFSVKSTSSLVKKPSTPSPKQNANLPSAHRQGHGVITFLAEPEALTGNPTQIPLRLWFSKMIRMKIPLKPQSDWMSTPAKSQFKKRNTAWLNGYPSHAPCVPLKLFKWFDRTKLTKSQLRPTKVWCFSGAF